MNRPEDLRDEPALSGASLEGDAPSADSPADSNAIWGEPALAGSTSAEAARRDRAAWLAAQWAAGGRRGRATTFLALAAAAGPFAACCSVLRETAFIKVQSLIAVAVLAPVVEEIAKIAAPLMVLERRPWAFSSAGALAALGALSGLVFASIENLLYFFVYLDEYGPGLLAWRIVVCTLLNVGCSLLCGIGLGRAWREAERERTTASLAPARSWIIAAMVIHGLYNAAACFWQVATRST